MNIASQSAVHEDLGEASEQPLVLRSEIVGELGTDTETLDEVHRETAQLRTPFVVRHGGTDGHSPTAVHDEAQRRRCR